MPSEVEERVGRMAIWELQNMVKALESLGGFFNSDEENERLRAAKTVLRERRKHERLARLQRSRRRK